MKQWKTENWFTSPWNFAEEVRNTIYFKDKIKIHDVTLRDGEQQAGLVFNKDQKVAFAEKLAELGVHRIEAGMPAVSKQDTDAIKEIVKRNLGPEIFAFGRCMKDDVKRAVDCGVKGVIIEIPSSEHIIEKAYKWPLEKAIELSIETTQFAKESGLYTVFFPIDASRADIHWFLDLIEKVATEGHMDALVLVDTLGGINPHSVPYLVKKVKQRISKPLELHFHDDFGLGAANTIFGLAAGADVAHTTITGIGERSGNAPFEDIIMALKTMYDIDLGIDTKKIYDVSRFMRDITGIEVRPNRPIVGDKLFTIESGIVTEWYKNCIKEDPTEVYPFKWDMVGQSEPKICMGKKSGLPNLEIWLDRLGLDVLEENYTEILTKEKDYSIKRGRALTESEFIEIVDSVR